MGYIAISDSLSVHKLDLINNKLIHTGLNFSNSINDRVFGASYNSDSKITIGFLHLVLMSLDLMKILLIIYQNLNGRN